VDIFACKNKKNPNIIKAVKEIQPVVLDFSLSDEVAMIKIRQIFEENKLL
jgi:hypothetical protein